MRAGSGYRAASLVVTAVAAWLRFWALDLGLPHVLARPDEEMIIAHTAPLARGEADLDWAVYPSAYVYLTWAWGAAGLRAGQVLGCMPEGGYLDILRHHPDRLLLVDRVLSAAVGTATVPVLMAVVSPAFGRPAALVAGTLLATNFLHARDSHAVKPDVLLALGIILALHVMVPLAERATAWRGALAGLAIGLTMAMKYPGVILLVPAYLAAVMGASARGWRRLVPGPALVLAAVAGAVFVATSPYLVFNPKTRDAIVYIVRVVFPQLFPEPPVLPIPAGAADRAWWDGLVYHASFSLRYGAGLPLTLLAPVAVVWGVASRRPLAVLAAAFAVTYYVVIGVSPAMHARYMTPLVPVLVLLEAGMLGAAARRLASGRAAGVALGAAAALLAAAPLASAIAHNRIAARTDTRVLATRWLAANLPTGARVAVVGTVFWPYGVPQMPSGVQALNVQPDDERLATGQASHLLTHDHVLFPSRVDPEAMAALAPRLRILVEFDPFRPGGRERAIFEEADAYYIPFHNFAAVERPGPLIRIYAFE